MSADVEQLLVTAAAAQFPDARVCTELPAAITGPTIQFERIGGPDRVPSLDPAVVDVECFDLTRAAANALANSVRDWIRYQLRGYTDQAQGATVSEVATVQGPGWRPYENTNVRRVGASYAVTVHNH